MDVSVIASAAVALLSPYLAKAGEELAKKAGTAAWDQVTKIHQAVKARFKTEEDTFPAQTLERFEKEPEKYSGGMEDVLKGVLKKDPEFSQSLADLLNKADRAGAGSVFNVSVRDSEVGEIINVDTLSGGLSIDKRSGT